MTKRKKQSVPSPCPLAANLCGGESLPYFLADKVRGGVSGALAPDDYVQV